ncbi:uncharacterized protein LOC142528329 [Primulina tabacum]|uniref:uncharacterized protein LOC142528329 n=1 Tax=Primulina tabacum TaxID=48773 RepID=UPI003F591B65
MASFNKIPMFSKEVYDDWKLRMQAHLAAQDDDMWYIITDGPMKILKVNTAAATIEGAPQMIEKHRSEWTAEDKKKANLDNVAKDILYKTLDKNMFAKIKTCTTAKEIWEKLTQLCEGKDYSNREIALKVMRALPREWDVKTIAMRESKYLNKLELHDLFADLKAYEFELGIRIEEDPLTSQQTKALPSYYSDSSGRRVLNKFMRKNQSQMNKPHFNKDHTDYGQACFNCGKKGHFISECNRPKKDEKKSSDRRRFKDNKRYIKKKNKRVLVAEEDKGKWVDSESKKSISKESSSESEDEKVECLMTKEDQESTDEVVFDFNSDEFTREDLVTALHDMVDEFKRLSQHFNEATTEKQNLENKLFHATLKENKWLIDTVNNWNKSSVSLNKMHEMQKPAGDKTGIGYTLMNAVSKKRNLEEFIWFLDSGYSRHMTRNKYLLSEVVNCKGSTITFGDNSKGKAVGKGNIIHGKIIIRDAGNIMITGHREQNTYKVKWNDDCLSVATCFVALNGNKNWLWHKRLNHLNFKSIATISKLNLVSGLPNIDFVKDRVCNACQLGKQVRSTFKNRGRNSSTRCLELLHMDLFGPIPVMRLGGRKYTLVVIDDFSRFTCVIFLSSKDQTADQLIKLLKRLQNEKSKAIDRIRSDRGTEFLNQFLSSYLEDHGIKHELSAARSPQQNGVAERRNRTLKEAARTMLAESGISQRFWAEAFNPACYTQNRSVINKNHEKTPYEIWTGKQPDVRYFRIFGCKCFIHINGKTHLTAFDVKADNGIFLGYSAVSKAYRAYNQRTLTVEESIRIVFDESSICHDNSNSSIHDLINNFDATNLEASSEDEVDLRKTGGSISKENPTAQEQTQQVNEPKYNQQPQNVENEEGALEQEEEIIKPTELNPY